MPGYAATLAALGDQQLARLLECRRDLLAASAPSSFAELASRAGSPRAVRAAGNALGANPIPVVVPCHRVLRTGGALGGYTGGVERKQFLLRLEGALA